VQVGAENKNKVRAAISLGVVAALLVGYQFIGSSSTPMASSTPATAQPVKPSPRRSTRTTGGKRPIPTEARLDPTLDLSTLAATEQMVYSGKGRNIFVATAEPIPRPKGSGVTDLKPPPPQPQGPPPPPPINLKFFGFASKPGEPKRIFLSQGEDVFIAGEGDIVNRRYKVLHIGPNSVDIEDVLYNNRQSIPLTQG
jgi:hypothetical protein